MQPAIGSWQALHHPIWPSPHTGKEVAFLYRVHLRKRVPPTCEPPEITDRTASRTLPGPPDSRTCPFVRDNWPIDSSIAFVQTYVCIILDERRASISMISLTCKNFELFRNFRLLNVVVDRWINEPTTYRISETIYTRGYVS